MGEIMIGKLGPKHIKAIDIYINVIVRNLSRIRISSNPMLIKIYFNRLEF